MVPFRPALLALALAAVPHTAAQDACPRSSACATGTFCTGVGVCVACTADLDCQPGCACNSGSCACGATTDPNAATVPARLATAQECSRNGVCGVDEYCYTHHCTARAADGVARPACRGRCAPVPASASDAFSNIDDDDTNYGFWLLVVAGVVGLAVLIVALVMFIRACRAKKAKGKEAQSEPVSALKSPKASPRNANSTMAPRASVAGTKQIMFAPSAGRRGSVRQQESRGGARAPPSPRARGGGTAGGGPVTTNPFTRLWGSPRSASSAVEPGHKAAPSPGGPGPSALVRQQSAQPWTRSPPLSPRGSAVRQGSGWSPLQAPGSGRWSQPPSVKSPTRVSSPPPSVKSPVRQRSVSLPIGAARSASPPAQYPSTKSPRTPSPRASVLQRKPGSSPYSSPTQVKAVALPDDGVSPGVGPVVRAAPGDWRPRRGERVACFYQNQYTPVTIVEQTSNAGAAPHAPPAYTIEWGDGETTTDVPLLCLHQLFPYLARVDALFEGAWHPGTVEEFAADGTYGISWDDGTATVGVPMADVRERTAYG